MNRTALAASLVCLTQVAVAAPDAGGEIRSFEPASQAAGAKVAALEHERGGRIGFFALDVATGRTIQHRPHERFAMCSTFKWLLAAHVLSVAFSQPESLSLQKRIRYGEADLIGYSPVTREHVRDGAMTVSALVDAAVVASDNTAANLLLPLVEGPQGLTRWLRGLGDEDTRLDRNEPTLNTNLPGDPRDTTTPAASAADLRNFLLGDALPRQARERLKVAMEHSQTGMARLRAGVPSDWRVADKTGTCDRGAVNDVAVVWPNDREPLVVVAYLSGSEMPLEKSEAIHAALARLAVEVLVGQVPHER